MIYRKQGKLKIKRDNIGDKNVNTHHDQGNHEFSAVIFKKHHFSLFFLIFHIYHIFSFPNSFKMLSS